MKADSNDGAVGSSKKKLLFREIDDVVSVGALLRPTIVKAVEGLGKAELETLVDTLVEAERRLADSRVEFRERFASAQELLVRTYVFAPIWRFISGRIEDCWKNSESLTVRELSIVSLLFGMMLEEAQRCLAKRRHKKSA